MILRAEHDGVEMLRKCWVERLRPTLGSLRMREVSNWNEIISFEA